MSRVVAHVLGALPQVGDAGGLDVRAYSLMKHGHLPSIHRLADELTQRIVAEVPPSIDPAVPVALPVAYLAVLPACGHLAARVAEGLRARRPADAARVHVVRIAKDAVTSIDYASSTAQQRREQMAALRFSLDEPVDGELVLLVDDVRVTGLAEEAAVAALLRDGRPRDIVTAYIAAATPDLAADPAVERALNHAAVGHPADLLPAMDAGEFVLTIRYLKWALAHPDAVDLLARIPGPLLTELRDGAVASGLWQRPEFATACRALDLALDTGLGTALDAEGRTA